MQLNSFSSLPEDDEELHLPKLVYYVPWWRGTSRAVIGKRYNPNDTTDKGYRAVAENDSLAVVKLLASKSAKKGNISY